MNRLIDNLEDLAGADIVLARSAERARERAAEARPQRRANPAVRAMRALLALGIGRSAAQRCRP